MIDSKAELFRPETCRLTAGYHCALKASATANQSLAALFVSSPKASALRASNNRTSNGVLRTHCRTGTSGKTRSTCQAPGLDFHLLYVDHASHTNFADVQEGFASRPGGRYLAGMLTAACLVDDLIRRALEEDLQGGDLTTEATVDVETRAIAHALARSPLVVCGGDVFARVFYFVDPGLRVLSLLDDGTQVDVGAELWQVEGSARSILIAERTALNFVQRMSGISTMARSYVDALPSGSKTRIVDTRKTTPGLRMLERYAVRTGGAHNHRDTLGSAVLIKDNHIEAAGGITSAITRAKARAPHTSRVEIEVETLEGVDEALAAGADIIMLDNFNPSELRTALERCRGRALVEVSGKITLERIAELGRLGVDIVSSGALTHSAKAADIALDIERIG